MHILFKNTNINVDNFKKVNYKKNEIVFNEGDKCNYIGLVESGSITITTYTYNEKEYEINNITDNGLFGEFIIFNQAKYLGTGIATKNTTVIQITKFELLELLKNKSFSENYLTLISNINLKIQQKIKLLSQKEIRDKIMFLLLENKKITNNNTFFFETKEKLSLLLNITRPSLSRELINMKKDNLIEYDLKSITLKKCRF